MQLARPLYLALVALAAMVAALCTVGAPAAGATVLCEVETGTTCNESVAYAAGTKFSGKLEEGTTAKFATTLGTISCKGSSLEGETTETEAEQLGAEVTSLVFTGCSLSETGCTITAENLPSSASIAYTEETNGTFSIFESGPMANIACGAFVKCKVGKEAALALKGGGPSKLVASEAKLSREGVLCPKEVKFSATYAISTPEAIYAAQDRRVTVLCEAAPTNVGGVLTCPNGKAYTGQTLSELETGAEATFTSSVGPPGVISCSTIELIGSFRSSGAPQNPGGVTSLEFKSGTMPCTSTLNMNPRVKVEALNIGWEQSVLAYERVGAPQGAMGFGTPLLAEQKLELTVGLTPAVTCEYQRGGLIGQITNAAGATESLLGITGFWVKTAGSATVCPSTMSEVARLKFLMPGSENIYLSGAGG